MDNKIIKIIIVVLMSISVSSSPALAVEPNQQTWFNSLTDTISTIGQDQQSKKEIIQLRKNSRREYRMQKDQLRKRKQTRKQMKQQQDTIKRKYNNGHTAIGL